jgi:hypothetical protein
MNGLNLRQNKITKNGIDHLINFLSYFEGL